MKVFYAKVFDGLISGTNPVYTQTAFAEMLGSAERLGFGAQMNAVSATSTLTVQIENSPDGTRWMNQNGTNPAELSATVNAGDNAVQYSTNARSTTIPIGNHVRLRISLSGAQTGYLRLWVVGRSPAF